MQLVTRNFQDLEIVFTQDNWVNATQTAKFYNKRLDNFLNSKRFKEYIQKVEDLRSLKISKLKKVVTGKGKEQGTYLHPYLAIEFARWLDAGFAVQMDMWFESEMTKELERRQTVIDRQQQYIDKDIKDRDKNRWWMND